MKNLFNAAISELAADRMGERGVRDGRRESEGGRERAEDFEPCHLTTYTFIWYTLGTPIHLFPNS